MIVIVVCVLGGLALAGVFSDSHSGTSPTTGSTAPPTTTTSPRVSPRPTVAAAPKTALRPGDNGTAVKLLQHALARLGYRPGAIDRQYGPSTTQAVARFQRDAQLTADGVLGNRTVMSLYTRGHYPRPRLSGGTS